MNEDLAFNKVYNDPKDEIVVDFNQRHEEDKNASMPPGTFPPQNYEAMA